MCYEFSLWVFAYGSLCWRAGFPYERKVVGCIKGLKRRFWQGSTDHRGVPGAPGRVVTLVEPSCCSEEDPHDDNDVVYGVAYCITNEETARGIIGGLDHREKGGYDRRTVDVFSVEDPDGLPIVHSAVVYIASEANEEFLGPESMDEMARCIGSRVGPSGPNWDYLFNLAEFMRSIGKVDAHVFDLEDAVRKYHAENGGKAVVSSLPKDLVMQGSVNGVLVIDHGAESALSQHGHSLMAVGLVDVQGTFGRDALVSLINPKGVEVSRGYTNYSSEELEVLRGVHSWEFAKRLGMSSTENNLPVSVVDRTRLILV